MPLTHMLERAWPVRPEVPLECADPFAVREMPGVR